MAYGDDKDFGWGNLIIKFALFLMNTILLLLGCVLLAVGIFAQIEAGTLNDYGVGDFLASPAIILIILGFIMFVLGFSGCLGALREVYYLLIIYCIIMTVLVFLEIGAAVFIYFQQDTARQQFDERIRDYIIRYYDNPDLQNIIDLTQRNLKCCGSEGPNDWEANIYFNCSSIAFQRCSVPFSCCEPPEGEDEIVNVQCGYRRLDSSNTERFYVDIYTEGCIEAVENLIDQYLYYVAGVGGAILLFQLINVMLTSGLAIDVKKEQRILKMLKEKDKKEKNLNRDLNRI